jgi:hypothetical protein
MDEFVGATVIFGKDVVGPILYTLALESVGIEIEIPKINGLRRLFAIRLKALKGPRR